MNEDKSKLKERLNFYKFPKEKIDSFSDELLANYKNCAYCGTSLDETNCEIEHIDTPTSPKDYVNKAYRENIVLCCGSCNRSKGKIPLEDWFKKIKNPEYLGTEYMNCEKRQTIIKWTTSKNHPNNKIKQTAEKNYT